MNEKEAGNMDHPRPLFNLFLVFFRQISIKFYNKLMWKNVHPVSSTVIGTHDLQNVSLLPLDQGLSIFKSNLSMTSAPGIISESFGSDSSPVYPARPVTSLNMKIEKRTKSSVTEMMDEPLMMPSQPPILAEKHKKHFLPEMPNFMPDFKRKFHAYIYATHSDWLTIFG